MATTASHLNQPEQATAMLNRFLGSQRCYVQDRSPGMASLLIEGQTRAVTDWDFRDDGEHRAPDFGTMGRMDRIRVLRMDDAMVVDFLE